MENLKPDETLLVGKIIIEAGSVNFDPIGKRILFLIQNKLQKKVSTSGGWNVLYLDKRDNRYWELTYPHSEVHGGGPPMLRVLTEAELETKYDLGITAQSGRHGLVEQESKIASGTKTNIPATFARAIQAGIPYDMLGPMAQVLVTDAQALRGLNSVQIAHKLNIPLSPAGFEVVEFSSFEATVIKSSIKSTNSKFIEEKLPEESAPEFVIPNMSIPTEAKIWFIND